MIEAEIRVFQQYRQIAVIRVIDVREAEPAEVLINGTTITRFEAREYDELEFFHIKLESHDVIYAEGAPAETLLNVEESAVNFAEYLRQYGTAARDEDRCAPHIHIWDGRIELMSRVRSALSPCCRTPDARSQTSASGSATQISPTSTAISMRNAE